MPETSQFQRSAITGSASAKIAFAFDFQENNALHTRAISVYPGQPVPVLVSPWYARRL